MIVEVKRSELPVEKGWFDYISSCFFIGTLALWKLWTWSSKTLKETVKSAENCMIYLLVLHDQMINAKFLISRLFDESPSVALWSFQFFNRDDVTPINYLEHDDSGCHWCVWFLSFPIINPTGWCSFLHCSTSVTDWRMCFLMVDLHARVFSIPLYLMMLSGWCLMWMASLSLTGAPVTIIIELLSLEKDEKVTCFNNPHVPRL